MKKIKNIFIVLLILITVYTIFSQLYLKTDVIDSRNVLYEYEEPWQLINEDGSTTEITLPFDLDDAKTYTIETVLPEFPDTRISHFGFKSQNMKVYLDGDLILDYDTSENSFFGEPSMLVYIAIPLSADDSGKTLRIEGVCDKHALYQAYLGTEFALIYKVVSTYSAQFFISMVTFVLALGTIIASLIEKILRKRGSEMFFVGVGVLIAALWIVINSGLRQMAFSNLSAGNQVPKFLVMLMPYPFLIFMNSIQKNRYETAYKIASWILTLANITYLVFYVINPAILRKIFIAVCISTMLSVMTILVSFLIDVKSKKMHDYLMVSVGTAGFLSTTIIQFIAYYAKINALNGTAIAVGMIWFLVCSVLFTLRNILSLESEKAAAIQASEAKGNFLAKMSHEIRTPINAVLGMNEMILRESKDSSIREYALDIQGAGRSLLSLINDILDISKIESDKLELVPARYSLGTMINDTVNMVSIKAKTKELEVITDIDPNLPSELYGDDIRIRQCIVNLLNNAVKYTEHGSVTLKIEEISRIKVFDTNQEHDAFLNKKDSDKSKTEKNPANVPPQNLTEDDIEKITIRYSIIDTGIGIKEDDLPKLYEKFTRIEEKRNRDIEGTGLGMNITISLLDMMNSNINVTSEYGKGSCFYFDLTQLICDNTPIGDISKKIREDSANRLAFETGFIAPEARILNVDDNAVNRKVIRNLLKTSKVIIDDADSGNACLELCEKNKYDLILLDHMMPEMDGVETFNRLRKNKNGLNFITPVIALTANAISGAKEMYTNLGFDEYLTKPIVYDDLEKTLIRFIPAEKVTTNAKIADGSNVESSGSSSALSVSSAQDVPSENELRELFESIPDINLTLALLSNPTLDMLFEISSDFIEQIDSEADNIESFYLKIKGASDENSLSDAIKNYRIKVHAMKSSSAMIGLTALSGVSKMLEEAAINNDADTIKSVTPAYLSMLRSYKQRLHAISDRINIMNNSSDKPAADMNVTLSQINVLKMAVLDFDFNAADSIVSFLKEFSYPAEYQNHLNELFTAIQNIDDEKALKIIENIESV